MPENKGPNQETVPDNGEVIVHPYITLPYKGSKGEHWVKTLKKAVAEVVPERVVPRFIFKGRKLGSFFSTKDKVNEKHLSKIVYGFNVHTMESNINHYIGETRVRHETRIYEHLLTDKNSAVYQHSREHGYTADPSNFKILATGYNEWKDRVICEALFVKDGKPLLNKQKQSHKLGLFN